MTTAQLVDRGRARFAAHAWADAFDVLSRVAHQLDPTDLERLAVAAHMAGHDDASTTAWTRAHQAWRARSDPAGAVRCAFWLGLSRLLHGDAAEGGGWLARARRILDDHDLDTVERGYLEVPVALMAIAAGDTGSALDALGRATASARRFGDADLATLGTLGRGQALLHANAAADVGDGLRLLDEAMVAVTAGETSPIVSGLVYCAVIESCHRVYDLRRACEWTAALERWCAGQTGLVAYRGQCLVHRAQVLQLRGEWTEALRQAEDALRRLSAPPHPAIGSAHYLLGELHRLRGHVRAAEDAFRQAHAAGRDPLPGSALLALDTGRTAAAAAAIETALATATDRLRRAEVLPSHVRIMLAAGSPDAAQRSVAELDELAQRGADTALPAIAGATRGSLLVATGDARRALAPLHDALDVWRGLGAPYEEARLRALIARAHRQLDDHDRADLELGLARAVFERLGAVTDAPPPAPSGGPLTARELDVLRLVAAGRTNREIGDALAISEKTVERHLGNMFTKLGVANRTAATAHAYHHRLL